MIYRIEWVENKGEGWKVATLVEGIENGQTFENVSINKTDKKTGAVAFSNFDSLAPGSSLEGSIWTNPSGRHYLFPPKPITQNRGNGPSGIKAAQERKAENIKEAQENKGHAIKVAAAMRDATLITIELLKADATTDWQSTFQEVKNWYLKEWAHTEKAADLPF